MGEGEGSMRGGKERRGGKRGSLILRDKECGSVSCTNIVGGGVWKWECGSSLLDNTPPLVTEGGEGEGEEEKVVMVLREEEEEKMEKEEEEEAATPLVTEGGEGKGEEEKVVMVLREEEEKEEEEEAAKEMERSVDGSRVGVSEEPPETDHPPQLGAAAQDREEIKKRRAAMEGEEEEKEREETMEGGEDGEEGQGRGGVMETSVLDNEGITSQTSPLTASHEGDGLEQLRGILSLRGTPTSSEIVVSREQ